MSHNSSNVEKSARRHRPAIWGIAFALLAAVIAGLVFAPWRSDGTQSEVVQPAVTGTAGNTPADPATAPVGTTAPADTPAPAGAAPAATGG